MKGPMRFQAEKDPRSALRVPIPIDVFQAQITTGTAHTARSDADFQIEHLAAVNVTASTDYVTVHLVPSGGSASTANTVVYQRAIAGREAVTIFTKDTIGFLQPGMMLQVLCGVNDAVNVWGHGFDYQGVYSD